MVALSGLGDGVGRKFDVKLSEPIDRMASDGYIGDRRGRGER